VVRTKGCLCVGREEPKSLRSVLAWTTQCRADEGSRCHVLINKKNLRVEVRVRKVGFVPRMDAELARITNIKLRIGGGTTVVTLVSIPVVPAVG
jgi:hypothetical protein